MSSQPNPVPHPLRRFLRFSVRGLIVVVLVIVVWLGWIVQQAHVQRDAVAAIRRSGGEVFYDWEWKDGHRIIGGEPWPPRWLVHLVGVDYFGQVTTVQLLSSASQTGANRQFEPARSHPPRDRRYRAIRPAPRSVPHSSTL
jgi:hypothetical protein